MKVHREFVVDIIGDRKSRDINDPYILLIHAVARKKSISLGLEPRCEGLEWRIDTRCEDLSTEQGTICSLACDYEQVAISLAKELKELGIYQEVRVVENEIINVTSTDIRDGTEESKKSEKRRILINKRFGYLRKKPKLLHGAYRQAVVSKRRAKEERSRKHASGPIREFLDQNPEYSKEFAVFLGELLYANGSVSHAKKVYYQYGILVPTNWRKPKFLGDFFDGCSGPESKERTRKLEEYITIFWENSGNLETYLAERWGPEHASINVSNPIINTMMKYGNNHWWESEDPLRVFFYQLFEDKFLVDWEKFQRSMFDVTGLQVSDVEFAFATTKLRYEALDMAKSYLLEELSK